ncbi:hypothetical protein [Natronorubrum halophilum]|uniref:hypothetical protein n=1 Tax=Natronorubrum halophilum TaxID=1702106 RepID=UPI001485A6F8|nr:hypothetical protein [Natronorubrum halophilum]
MTFQLPTTCPICQETLALDRSLDDHLVGSHTHREVAGHLVSQHDPTGAQSVAD